jgi:hypothetical protein
MYRLFVDLDGVLVDFDRGVRSVTGKRPDEQSPRQMWPQLARADRFYETLSWTADGRRLWDAVRDLSPTILTGLPMGTWAEPQKRAWCRRELGPDVPVITCMSRDKGREGRHATPEGVTPVLIDDRERLAESWIEHGGVFVHHQDADRTLAELRSHGLLA